MIDYIFCTHIHADGRESSEGIILKNKWRRHTLPQRSVFDPTTSIGNLAQILGFDADKLKKPG